MALRRSRHRAVDIWPGFVDALGNLLIILIFILLVFVLAQFILGRTLSGKERELDRSMAALVEKDRRLSQQDAELARLVDSVADMAEQLKLQKETAGRAKAARKALEQRFFTLTQRARALESDNEAKTAAAAKLAADVEALEALKAALERKIAERDRRLGAAGGKLVEQEHISEQARTQAALLRQQLQTLENEMARLAAALDASEALNDVQKGRISDLGRKLNRALATKVQELQKYRSEFFGRLRAVLGRRSDIRIVGDRFVFQSEVLFASGSAELQKTGRERLTKFAETLKDIARSIPQGIDWILRVDGHTDIRPINSAKFKSNWELSAARAISVVRFLIKQGVAPRRLAAAGFGEFQPLAPGTAPADLAQNRRIELKLDQR